MKVKFLHHQGQWKPGDEVDLDDVTANRMISTKRAVPAKPTKAATKKRSGSPRAKRPAPAAAADPTTTAGPDAKA